jgi:hypothetical protein
VQHSTAAMWQGANQVGSCCLMALTPALCLRLEMGGRPVAGSSHAPQMRLLLSGWNLPCSHHCALLLPCLSNAARWHSHRTSMGCFSQQPAAGSRPQQQ